MTVTKITKLTPPQITALRETFPALVEAGILSTTKSIATFDLGEHEPSHPLLRGWTPTPRNIRTLVQGCENAGKIDAGRAAPIITKLTTGKDVVVQ